VVAGAEPVVVLPADAVVAVVAGAAVVVVLLPQPAAKATRPTASAIATNRTRYFLFTIPPSLILILRS
jgi:hypothetical protein